MKNRFGPGNVLRVFSDTVIIRAHKEYFNKTIDSIMGKKALAKNRRKIDSDGFITVGK
mgnify:CR=1 FL=1